MLASDICFCPHAWRIVAAAQIRDDTFMLRLAGLAENVLKRRPYVASLSSLSDVGSGEPQLPWRCERLSASVLALVRDCDGRRQEPHPVSLFRWLVVLLNCAFLRRQVPQLANCLRETFSGPRRLGPRPLRWRWWSSVAATVHFLRSACRKHRPRNRRTESVFFLAPVYSPLFSSKLEYRSHRRSQDRSGVR